MPDDIVTNLREHAQWLSSTQVGYVCGQAADEIERLRAVIDAVADLHEPDHTNEPRCLSCGEWPCPTHLILCNECKEAPRV